MKYLALFKRVNRGQRYSEIGVVEADDPLEAEQVAVSRLDDEQKRSWFKSRIIIKLYELGEEHRDGYDTVFQEDLNALRSEEDNKHLSQMEAPEGGWPRGSDADLL